MGNHVELEDADLLDYDKEDALSTVHEVGIEEDLEDQEIQGSQQIQQQVYELNHNVEQPPTKEEEMLEMRPPSPSTEATKDVPQREEDDPPMEENAGDAPPPDVSGFDIQNIFIDIF